MQPTAHQWTAGCWQLIHPVGQQQRAALAEHAMGPPRWHQPAQRSVNEILRLWQRPLGVAAQLDQEWNPPVPVRQVTGEAAAGGCYRDPAQQRALTRSSL